MKRIGIIGVFLGVVVLFSGSTPAASSSPDDNHSTATVSALNAEQTAAKEPVIAVLAEDGISVSSFAAHASFLPVRAADLHTADIDAVVISRPMLTRVVDDAALRAHILEIARQQKPVVATHTSLTELASHLGLTLPTLQTETTRSVMSSLVWGRDGVPRVQVLLISTDRMSTFGTDDLSRAISNHVVRLSASSAASPSMLPDNDPLPDAAVAQLSNSVFLPLITNDPGIIDPGWKPAPTIDVEWNNCPLGLYREELRPDWVESDQDDARDFYNLRIVQQTIPGKAANEAQYPDCAGSDYRTSRIRARADVYYQGQKLHEYGPTTTSGETTATVNIGFSGTSVALTIAWAFNIPSLRIEDRSDLALEWAEWDFIFATDQAPANTSFLTEPGVTVSTNQGIPLGMRRPVNLYWRNIGDVQRFDTWFYTVTPEVTDVECAPGDDEDC
jgi:hypothetical protein